MQLYKHKTKNVQINTPFKQALVLIYYESVSTCMISFMIHFEWKFSLTRFTILDRINSHETRLQYITIQYHPLKSKFIPNPFLYIW